MQIQTIAAHCAKPPILGGSVKPVLIFSSPGKPLIDLVRVYKNSHQSFSVLNPSDWEHLALLEQCLNDHNLPRAYAAINGDADYISQTDFSRISHIQSSTLSPRQKIRHGAIEVAKYVLQKGYSDGTLDLDKIIKKTTDLIQREFPNHNQNSLPPSPQTPSSQIPNSHSSKLYVASSHPLYSATDIVTKLSTFYNLN